MLKIAIVGLGKMGQRHAENWAKMEGVELVGLVGRDQTKLAPLTEKWNTSSFLKLEDLLTEKQVDVLDICLPTILHAETIHMAAQYDENISIICEKPLCLTNEEAKKVKELVRKTNINVYVGHTLRFDDEYRSLRTQVKSGAVGDVGVVRLLRKTAYPGGWFAEHDKSGGIIYDLGIHDLDWLLWTFGDAERVMARHIISTKDRYFEHALLTIRMKNGVIAHLELSWASDHLQSSAEIAGNEGLLITDSDGNQPIQMKTITSKEERSYLSKDLVGESPIYRQLHHFKSCIKTEQSSIISFDEAGKAVQLAEAAITSVKTNQVVYVEEEVVQ